LRTPPLGRLLPALGLGFMTLVSVIMVGVALRGLPGGLESEVLRWAPYAFLLILGVQWVLARRREVAFASGALLPLILGAAALLLAGYALGRSGPPSFVPTPPVGGRPVIVNGSVGFTPYQPPSPPAGARLPLDFIVVAVVVGVLVSIFLVSSLALRRLSGVLSGAPAAPSWVGGDEPPSLPGGVRGRILASYLGVLKLLERRVVPRLKSQTAREYERAVLDRVPWVAVDMVSLTRVYEVARFTGRELEEADALRAEEAAARIKGMV
jgi:hypothetical protein